MRIAALPQIHEMPTRCEPRNLTQCLCYATAKANSVPALAGIMSQLEHTNLALEVWAGLQDTLQTPLLDSSDTLSKVCVILWLGWFSQVLTVLRNLICHCSDEQGNRVRWTGHLGELSCPTASQSCTAECSWPCCAVPAHAWSSWSWLTFLLSAKARCPGKSPQCEHYLE